jgi:hypothetical protein
MTATVDIKEQDLVNFVIVGKNLPSVNLEQSVCYLLEQYPFTLYRKRMMGESFVTIQIPLENYCLFLGHQLVI